MTEFLPSIRVFLLLTLSTGYFCLSSFSICLIVFQLKTELPEIIIDGNANNNYYECLLSVIVLSVWFP